MREQGKIMVWAATANVPCSSLKKFFWATQAATSPFRIGIAAVTGALFRENERGASALIGSPIFCAVHLDDERRFHHLWKVPEDRAKLKGLQQALSLEASATRAELLLCRKPQRGAGRFCAYTSGVLLCNAQCLKGPLFPAKRDIPSFCHDWAVFQNNSLRDK